MIPIEEYERIKNIGYKSGREDAIREISDMMYHEAFEVDHDHDDMQMWDGGCWVRYKLFEDVIKRVEFGHDKS